MRHHHLYFGGSAASCLTFRHRLGAPQGLLMVFSGQILAYQDLHPWRAPPMRPRHIAEDQISYTQIMPSGHTRKSAYVLTPKVRA